MVGAVLEIIDTLSSGIPGIIVAGLSLVFLVLALVRGDPGMMMIAGVMTIPMTYVAGGWVGWGLVIRLLPLLAFVSAYFIGNEDMVIAWLVPMPLMLYVGFFVFKLIYSAYQSIEL